MFRFKIAFFSTLISGSVLIVFGLFFLFVINKVGINRIDREILSLGESQLNVFHPKEHWQNFGDSIRFIYGQDKWKDLVVQISGANNHIFYQSPHWPNEISTINFSDFDFQMEMPPQSEPPPEHPVIIMNIDISK